jgi:hypothetical protein
MEYGSSDTFLKLTADLGKYDYVTCELLQKDGKAIHDFNNALTALSKALFNHKKMSIFKS